MDITFKITRDELAPAIQRAIRAGMDFTLAMEDVSGVLEFGVRRRFETGEDPEGQPWVSSQRAIEEGGRTLTDTGALLGSIAAAFDATGAIVGTNLVYAAIHQFGGTIKAKPGKALNTPFGPRGAVNMPARPFLGFGPYEAKEIEAILSRHLKDAFEGRP